MDNVMSQNNPNIHDELEMLRRENQFLTSELHQLRSWWAMLMKYMPVEIYVKNTRCQFIEANQATLDVLGVASKDELLGKTDRYFSPPDIAQTLLQEEQDILNSGQTIVQRESEFIDRNGHRKWNSVTKVPIYNQKQEVTGLIGINHNITKLKETYEKLDMEKSLLRTIIDYLPDLIYVKDTQGRYTLVNKTQLESWNLSNDDIIGLTHSELFSANDERGLETAELNAIEDMRPIFGSIQEYQDFDGSIRYITEIHIPLVDRENEPIGVIGVRRDFTKQVKTIRLRERQLRRFNEAVVLLSQEDDPNELLKIAIGKVKEVSFADWVVIVLINNSGHVEELIEHPSTYSLDNSEIRSNGLSIKIINDKKTVHITNVKHDIRINPVTQNLGYNAVIGLPMPRSNPIGVAWMHYQDANKSKLSDISDIQSFVDQVAYAYVTASRLSNLNQLRKSAKLVTNLMTGRQIDDILSAIADGVLESSSCNVVVLYMHDLERQKLVPSNAHRGLLASERIAQFTRVLPYTLIEKVINLKQPFHLREQSTLNLLEKKIFQRENIKSGAIIPLRLPEQVGAIGVLFVGYRTNYNLHSDEIANLQLFADQAAVSINQTNLRNIADRRNQTLNSLYSTSRDFIRLSDKYETLSQIALSALEVVDHNPNTPAIEEYSSYVAIVENGSLNFKATAPENLIQELYNAQIASVQIDKLDQKSGITFDVFQKGISRIANNVESEEDYLNLIPTTKSQITVPMKIKNKIVGLIGVESNELRAFTKEDLNNLEALAAFASISLSNIKQFESVQAAWTTAQELKNISVLGEPYEILEAIATRTKEVFSCDIVTLYAYHEESQTLDFGKPVIVGAQFPEEIIASTHKWVPDNSLVRRMVSRDTFYYVPIVQDDTLFSDKPFAKRESIVTSIAVPLITNSKKMGVIFLNFRTHRYFEPSEITNIELFAQQAAIAIANSRLYARERRTITLIGTLSKFVPEITASKQTENKLKEMMSLLSSVVYYDRANILDTRTDYSKPIVTVGYGGYEDTIISSPNNIINYEMKKRVIEQEKVILEQDSLPEQWKKVPINHAIGSWLGIKLSFSGEMIGVLALARTKQHQVFNLYDLEMLETFTSLISVALYTGIISREKDQQFGELQRTLQDLRETHKSLQNVVDYMESYRSLAKIGLLYGEYMHYAGGRLGAVRREAFRLKRLYDKGFYDSPKFPKHIDAIINEIDQFDNTLNKTQKDMFPETEVNLHVLLDNIIFSKNIPPEVTIEKNYKERRIDPIINGYEAQIRQVFFVIIENAIDEMRDGGILAIKSAEINHKGIPSIRISFKDNGPGIPEEKQSILFNEVGIKVSSKKGGSGRGLYWANHFMRMTGGEITFTTQVGRGTTFHVRFPRNFRDMFNIIELP